MKMITLTQAELDEKLSLAFKRGQLSIYLSQDMREARKARATPKQLEALRRSNARLMQNPNFI